MEGPARSAHASTPMLYSIEAGLDPPSCSAIIKGRGPSGAAIGTWIRYMRSFPPELSRIALPLVERPGTMGVGETEDGVGVIADRTVTCVCELHASVRRTGATTAAI